MRMRAKTNKSHAAKHVHDASRKLKRWKICIRYESWSKQNKTKKLGRWPAGYDVIAKHKRTHSHNVCIQQWRKTRIQWKRRRRSGNMMMKKKEPLALNWMRAETGILGIYPTLDALLQHNVRWTKIVAMYAYINCVCMISLQSVFRSRSENFWMILSVR